MSNRLPFYSDLRITFRDSIFLLPVPVRHAATPSARCVGVSDLNIYPDSIFLLPVSIGTACCYPVSPLGWCLRPQYISYTAAASLPMLYSSSTAPGSAWAADVEPVYPILQQPLCRCCTAQQSLCRVVFAVLFIYKFTSFSAVQLQSQ